MFWSRICRRQCFSGVTDLQVKQLKQANFEKIVIPDLRVTYLMEYGFTFTSASREFPPADMLMVHYL